MIKQFPVSCIYCKEIKSSKGIYTHVDRTHLKLTKYSTGNNNSYEILKKRAEEKKCKLQEKYLNNPNKCKQCNLILDYDKKRYNFCSKSCSAIYTNSRKDFTKIKTGPKKIPPKFYEHTCTNCNLIFESNKKKQTYCTRRCSLIQKNAEARKNRPALTNYRADCSFKFSLNDYPAEFDFKLIEAYGWYRAKNKGNNLGGVSRDHMVSVKYGFDNNIDPKIISHPANCRLIRHPENISKNSENYLTLEELLNKIEEWHIKYR